MNKLREKRRKQGLPALGLAVKAHVSTATISAIERWDYVPSPDVRARIATVLNLMPSEIWPDCTQNECGHEA